MYKDITDIQLKFYLLFEIQGNVCPLHSMPGYSCEHYNKGTCIYEEDCIYYPNITDTKLVDLILLARKYSRTIYYVNGTTREDLKNQVLDTLINSYKEYCNNKYSTKADEMLGEVKKIFGQN